MADEKARDKQVGGDHYKGMAIQPGEYITQNNLNWYEGNVIKYVTRHRQKGGAEDIKKAIHYLQLLLEQEYPVTNPVPRVPVNPYPGMVTPADLSKWIYNTK